MAFKIGDRVKLIGFTATNELHIGYEGIIKYLSDTWAGVEWDKNVGGHNGLGDFEGKKGHCYFVFPTDIKLVNIQQELFEEYL